MIQQPEIKIKQLRELKNYTQEHMASQLGLSTRAYSKIESGETQLTINRLNDIAHILGIKPIEVLGFDHKNIFNKYAQEANFNQVQSPIIEKLMEQYERRIQGLESEVLFLRTLVK